MKKIRYYISGHGLGHASRSCQIINTLRQRHPDVAVEVVSDAHPWFFKGFLDPSVSVRSRKLDIGVLQQDSLVMQEEKTLNACLSLLGERDGILAEEAASLAAAEVSLVAADIPPLAFAAARRAGIPSVGISNFTWDWIYEGFADRTPGFKDVIDAMRADYAQAELLLSLPFNGEFSAFDQVEQLPLVARKSMRSRSEIRRELGVSEDVKLGLISFGGFGLGDYDFSPLAKLKEWVFLTESGLSDQVPNVQNVSFKSLRYPDLVKAADVVITKPGYGIVSECIAAQTAVLYTSRGDFREQRLLVEAMCRYTRAREISNEALRRGQWGEDLQALLGQPAPREVLPDDGDVVAADRLAELVKDASV